MSIAVLIIIVALGIVVVGSLLFGVAWAYFAEISNREAEDE